MLATAPTSPKRQESGRRHAAAAAATRHATGDDRPRIDDRDRGLTAAMAVLPGDDAQALQSRVEAWKQDIGPRGVLEDYLIEKAAHASWQLDRADRAIAARIADRRAAPDGRAFDDVAEEEFLRQHQASQGTMLLSTIQTLLHLRKEEKDRAGDASGGATPPSVDHDGSGPDEIDWQKLLEKAGIAIHDLPESDQRFEPAAPPAAAIDPCSEGRHDESVAAPPPMIHLGGGADESGRARVGHRATSRRIPPIIRDILNQVLGKEAPADRPAGDAGGPDAGGGPP